MTPPIQCDNCGAVLLDEDVFCGECGAPRPSLDSTPKVMEEPHVDAPPAAQPAGRSDANTIWRVIVAILATIGALLCLLGFAAFILVGLMEGEGISQGENWLFSTICCLLPIAGSGTVVAVAGMVIWWARLRDR